MDDHCLKAEAFPVPPAKPERCEGRGSLKVFLGMAPGVGKTAAMLRAALADKLAGREVVIANVQARGVQAVEVLAGRLSQIESRGGNGIELDKVLARRPDLAVVDELAQANAAGARHPKRFQDVLELLEAGIDVYTTLNVYEMASRSDLLWAIAGATSHQTVPDSVFDNAVILLVDLPPPELIQRFKQGQIPFPEGCGLSKSRLFEMESLMALREMAARLFAERVSRDAQEWRRVSSAVGAVKAGHRILAAVEASWDAEELILWTRRLAGSLNAPWIVLYVETSRRLPVKEESRLGRNLELARELGAEVITTASEDLVAGVLRVASSRNITQIVAGKMGAAAWWWPFSRDTVVTRLIEGSGDMGVHVAPVKRGKPAKPLGRSLVGSGWRQYLTAMAAAGVVTAVGFLFTPLVGAQATALSALLAIVVLALFVERGPVLLAAALIAVIWDYFFFAPVFAFRIAHVEDALLLGMYFVVALALGQLTARIRAQEVAERQREGRATALYLLGRELAEATTLHQIIPKVVAEMQQCFDAEVAVLLLDAAGRLQVQTGSSLAIGEKEQAIAAWVLEQRKPAGKFTENLSLAEAMFVPLESGQSTIGVMGLRLRQATPPTIHQRNLLDALTGQIALALDRQRLSELSEKARMVAESERLGKTLLDSMSHEIRTPLAGIKAAVTDLAALGLVSAPGEELIAEIQEATQRLNRLVGKVLDITRLESGHVAPLLNECDVYEIVNLAVEETEKDLARHPFTLDMEQGLPIIRTDFVFVQQALMNLLSNAAVHTPAGTAIEVRVRQDGKMLIFEVADRGPGIDPPSLPRLFDKFYRGAAAPTGGTGLGLSLVKGFVEALGGKVNAENRAGGGAVFTIILQSARAEHRKTVSF